MGEYSNEEILNHSTDDKINIFIINNRLRTIEDIINNKEAYELFNLSKYDTDIDWFKDVFYINMPPNYNKVYLYREVEHYINEGETINQTFYNMLVDYYIPIIINNNEIIQKEYENKISEYKRALQRNFYKEIEPKNLDWYIITTTDIYLKQPAGSNLTPKRLYTKYTIHDLRDYKHNDNILSIGFSYHWDNKDLFFKKDLIIFYFKTYNNNNYYDNLEIVDILKNIYNNRFHYDNIKQMKSNKQKYRYLKGLDNRIPLINLNSYYDNLDYFFGKK